MSSHLFSTDPQAPESYTVVYTDGSALGNGRAGARAGYGVFWGYNDDLCVPLAMELAVCRTYMYIYNRKKNSL